MEKRHIDRLNSVNIIADELVDTDYNCVCVHYTDYDKGSKSTIALNLAYDRESIQKVKALLQSAIDSLNTL